MNQSDLYKLPWFQRLLALSPQAAQKVEKSHISFAAAWPQLTVIALGAFALVWFSWTYWRDGTRPSWWIKGPLLILRLLAIAALVIMLAQPVLNSATPTRLSPMSC